jgi:hypothetical protein
MNVHTRNGPRQRRRGLRTRTLLGVLLLSAAAPVQAQTRPAELATATIEDLTGAGAVVTPTQVPRSARVQLTWAY